MEGTRLRILQLLQKNNQQTVEGLAKDIGLAPATIRRHLDILQRDRLVEFEEVRKRTGRPEYSFYLTEEGQEALPKDYDRLLSMVVGELASLTAEETSGRDGTEILHHIFKRLSSQISKERESQLSGKDIGQRLDTLLGILQEQDFFPDVEIEGEKLHIKLMNCPFRSVALQNNSICSYDYHLISAMLDVEAVRGECIHNGAARCMYVADVSPEQAKKLSAVRKE